MRLILRAAAVLGHLGIEFAYGAFDRFVTDKPHPPEWYLEERERSAAAPEVTDGRG